MRLVDDSVLPWLLVTTTNLSRNLVRGLRRYRTVIAALPRAEVGISAEDIVLHQIEELRLSNVIRDSLSALSPSDAALIALTLYEGYSPTEVACALGISDGAARTRLHRARSRMAEAIATNEDAPEMSTKESRR